MVSLAEAREARSETPLEPGCPAETAVANQHENCRVRNSLLAANASWRERGCALGKGTGLVSLL